ncbi:MAG: MBL fold metallo-hydrolase [Acinetobacter sp.]
MKITFLGTSAGEGYPGIWCSCKHCEYARAMGGKNLRANSCAQVDDDIMLDMNAECFGTANRLHVNLRSTRYLLVTHPHEDHFIPQHLLWRRMPEGADKLTWEQMHEIGAPCFTKLPQLHIVGGKYVLDKLKNHQELIWDDATFAMDFTQAHGGKTIVMEDLKITPVRSIHGPYRGYTYNYIIQRAGKTLLYALDTGGYEADMMEVLHSFQYDCIVMEGTCGEIKRDPGGHMNTQKNIEMLHMFQNDGLLKENGIFCLSHMSPHWTPPHDEYAPRMAKEGMEVAYDGKILTF